MTCGFGISVAEVALEAWTECRPRGYVVEEGRLPDLLPAIFGHVPKGSFWQQSTDLSELFVPRSAGDKPVFLQLLKPQGGKVHFLYFWKAFGEVARMADSSFDDGLASELEMVRDRILRKLEEESQNRRWAMAFGAHPYAGRLKTQALNSEIHRAAAMSVCPKFWQAFTESLAESQKGDLNLEELTYVFLSLLRYAPVWEQQASKASAPDAAATDGLTVRLHIYDVSREESIQKLNRVLAHQYSPVKLGGVFHAGVEVNGLEWSFGYSPAEAHPGVACVQPKKHPQHHFRQTVVLKETKMPPEDIAGIISNMIEEYPGYDYDLLRRNCCHFADDFCRRLGVGGIPGWVHRLARLGASIDNVMRIM
mmetsp:Transcript_116693/g.341613  ORF Transcript_116693/g.341613 Transcript_116693/m.341613 type:complete len:365 (-) Transcript_116693:82-1176(-)